MRLIYNSAHFCVLEFGQLQPAGAQTVRVAPQAETVARANPLIGGQTLSFAGGFEILDKAAKREIFLAGPLAVGFREHLRQWAQTPPSLEEVDDFLASFQGLAQQPLVLH